MIPASGAAIPKWISAEQGQRRAGGRLCFYAVYTKGLVGLFLEGEERGDLERKRPGTEKVREGGGGGGKGEGCFKLRKSILPAYKQIPTRPQHQVYFYVFEQKETVGILHAHIRDAPAHRRGMDLPPVRGKHKLILSPFDLIMIYWWVAWPWSERMVSRFSRKFRATQTPCCKGGSRVCILKFTLFKVCLHLRSSVSF